MKNRVARFAKVSLDQYIKDMKEEFGSGWTDEELEEIYGQIKLPSRATIGSAGYDFKAPFEFSLSPRDSIKIPTGIRCFIEDGWWLGILPRSGHGFKYYVRLANSLAVIDMDYVRSENQGHIMIKLRNESKRNIELVICAGEAFAQGIFLPYGITYDDQVTEIRNGGFGSTDR